MRVVVHIVVFVAQLHNWKGVFLDTEGESDGGPHGER
jgi:hypothetical protein